MRLLARYVILVSAILGGSHGLCANPLFDTDSDSEDAVGAFELEGDDQLVYELVSAYLQSPEPRDIDALEVSLVEALAVGYPIDVNHSSAPSALDLATDYQDKDLVELLLRLGARVNPPVSGADHPILRAMGTQGSQEIFELLVDHCSDLGVCPNFRRGRTWLVMRFPQITAENVRTLIRAGVDPNQADRLLATPVQFLLTRPFSDGLGEVLEALFEGGAKLPVGVTDPRVLEIYEEVQWSKEAASGVGTRSGMER